MLGNILKQGSSVNASKPVGVLNMPASSGAMLTWYQDKHAGVLNRLADSGAILGKRDMVNAPLYTWVVKNDNILKTKTKIYKYMFRPIVYDVIRE